MSRPVITVVGLGPGDVDLATVAAVAAIEAAEASDTPLYFRTARHPAAATLLGRRTPPPASTHTFDDLYASLPTFGEVYEGIVSALLDAAREHGAVVYAVPGSPFVAERTVELLLERVELEFIAGLSFCDAAWTSLRIDPVAKGVRLIDGASFGVQAAGESGPLLVAQCWSTSVLSDIKLSIEEPRPDQQAVILHHLGLADEVVTKVAWSELDRTLTPDHLTSIYIEGLGPPIAADIVRLVETMATLRERCPWDRKQTHTSLVRHLLEETYETIEALEALGDTPEEAPQELVEHAAEELGDLLCQVVFHANIAREEGLFDFADVARTLNDKLVRRHPHVFGDLTVDTADEVVTIWEQVKRGEKGREFVLDGIPAALPALARAAAVERKLRGMGLGIGDGGVSMREGVGGSEQPEPPDAAAGAALLDLARHLAHDGIDPEAALRQALDRLIARANATERAVAADAGGVALADLPAAERIVRFQAAVPE